MSRILTLYQKEQAVENKKILAERQGGKCYYCPIRFERDEIIPHAAHIIIDSKVNIRKYGYEILDHIDNFKITCPNCNSKAIISNPESQTGIDHIESIRISIAENNTIIQEILDRR